MAIRTVTSLKSVFEAGDKPSEENFSDLIDSTYSGEIGAAIVSAVSAGSTGVLQVDSVSAVSFLATGTAGIALLSANSPASARTVLSAASAGDAIFQIGTVASVRSFIGAASTSAATTASAGIIQIATTAEATALTDASKAITPATLAVGAGRITVGTPTATTSGTSHDFTDLDGAKEIDIEFNGVSTDGTSIYEIKLGDAGGIEEAGYDGLVIRLQAAGTVLTAWPTDAIYVVSSPAASHAYTGVITLRLTDESTNTWEADGKLTEIGGDSQFVLTDGIKALSGPLTQLRLTTSNGTDTFDAGAVTVTIKT